MTNSNSATSISSDSPRPPPAVEDSSLFSGPVNIRSFMLTGIFILLLFYTFYFAAPLLIPIALAILLNLLLSPVVRLLARMHIPQPVGAALVLGFALGLFVTAVMLLSDPAQEWMKKAPEGFYQIETKLRMLKEPIKKFQQATDQIEKATQLSDEEKPQQVTAVDRPSISQLVLSSTSGLLAGLGIVVVLLYFLLAAGDSFRRKMVSVIPRLHDKKLAVEIMHSVERDISYYLLTVTIINIGLGVVVTLVLMLLGVPNPILWGAMVAILNYAPYIGPAASTIVLTIVGLLSFDSVLEALMVPGSFLLITTVEGQFITPMILGQRLLLSPVAIFLSMILWGWLWGVAGALLAVPLLASLKIVCDNLEPLQPLAEFLEP
jgi:predicted PurR-regulated permease PerM